MTTTPKPLHLILQTRTLRRSIEHAVSALIDLGLPPVSAQEALEHALAALTPLTASPSPNARSGYVLWKLDTPTYTTPLQFWLPYAPTDDFNGSIDVNGSASTPRRPRKKSG